MNHASLFSGIGGFDLAAEWMGWNNVFHCELNEYCQKVLKYHFPKSISYNDITKTDFTIHRGEIDILTGGFPCQPHSRAGKQLGSKDERDLWSECKRTISEIRPRYALFENVSALLTTDDGRFFNRVLSDLAEIGYNAEWCCIPASLFGAPHIRERIWIISYPNSNFSPFRFLGGNGKESSERNKETKEWSTDWKQSKMGYAIYCGIRRNKEWLPEPTIPKLVNGVPSELDEIRSFGNAIVPKVALEIFKLL